jgi:hypothetical protein
MRYRIKLPIEVESKGYEVRFEIVIPRDADNVLVCFYNCGSSQLNRCVPNSCEELRRVLLRATSQNELNVTEGKAAALLGKSLQQDTMGKFRGCERRLA